jgi:glycosyltransferase involved in cell wall biosynthesis
MRIGVDARPLIGRRTGIGNYVLGVLQAAAPTAGEREFLLYSPRSLGVTFSAPGYRLRVHRGVKGTNGTMWLQWYGRRLAEQDGVDLFWGAHFLLPVRLSRRIPAVVTVYDLVPLLFPHTMEWRNLLAMRLLLRASVQRADRVVAISETARADIHRLLGVPLERITVVYPGVAPSFGPCDAEEARVRVALAFGLPAPYLLTVGTIEPRKNLLTVIKAFASLPGDVRRGCTLAVAGASGWRTSAIHAAAEPLIDEGSLRFLGYVPDEDLSRLYAGAAMLLFPSAYEGFGMPIIEAMACGTPVVASDIPVLREVAADAAMFVSTTDVSAWREAVARLVRDAPMRENLRGRGLRRAMDFSFADSARRMVTIWERAAH